jgi:hypothetical protein
MPYTIQLVPDEARPPTEQIRRLTDSISLGVLADVLPRDLIEEVLNETGKREKRSRLLPAHVIVRFCQAMCLFYEDDYEEVMRKLVGSLEDMNSWAGNWQVPSVSAISQARSRLGPEPMRELFDRVARPIADLGTKGAWLGSRRLMAVDGFVLDVPDTPANEAAFRLSRTDGIRSSYPQVRVLGLGECGSHAIVDAAVSGSNTGEQTLLPQLFRSFEPDMLVLADRNFYGYDLWQQALDTDAALLWRIVANINLPVAVELADGSYLSVVFPKDTKRNLREKILKSVSSGRQPHPAQATVVRVIEYDIPDRPGRGNTKRSGSSRQSWTPTTRPRSSSPPPTMSAGNSKASSTRSKPINADRPEY